MGGGSAPAPQPASEASPEPSNEEVDEIVPPELHTDQHDNTDELISNLAKNIKLTDKEMNPSEEQPKLSTFVGIGSSEDKPEDDLFVDLGSSSQAESMM